MLNLCRRACGVGVFKIKYDNKSVVENQLKKINVGENFIMEQLIVRNEGIAKVNPSSVNNIRVITMVDRNGEVYIINTLAKFGGGAVCISNTMGGGCCCHIDEKTGIISP